MSQHLKSVSIKMEPWSIPRASLGSISSHNSHDSCHNQSSVKIHSKKPNGNINRGYHSEGSDSDRRNRSRSKTLSELHNKFDGHKKKENSDSIKRGSHSSQGSTDSNHSTQSASSGSLLLTAANLERFTQNHKKHSNMEITNIKLDNHQHYKTNITLPTVKRFDHICETTIPIDPNLVHVKKTKDIDCLSIASSTHFTVVNGIGGPQRSSDSGICSRGHQITVLIISMSLIFLIGIILAIYLLEMRAREMPH